MVADPFLFGQDADVFDLRADLDRVITDFEVFGDGDGIATLQLVPDGITDGLALFLGSAPLMRAFGTHQQRPVLISIGGFTFRAWGKFGGHGNYLFTLSCLIISIICELPSAFASPLLINPVGVLLNTARAASTTTVSFAAASAAEC